MRLQTGVAGLLGRLRGPSPQPAPARRPPGPGPVPECPAGWVTGPPDFVGVGSKKAGTSWWHHLVTAHPGIHRRTPAAPDLNPPGVKEVHFFQGHWAGPFGDDGAAAYHRYFPRPPDKLVGEWTPRYMVDFWTPAQLRRAAPDAKLLVLVRDPVERFRSGVSHYLARHSDVEVRVLIDEFERGRYLEGLERLERHYPRSQILVLQYELCVRQPHEQLRRTYEFLGLDEVSFMPEDHARGVNTARGRKLELDGTLRAELVAEYSADVVRLAERWAVDLSLWPNFSQLP